MNSEWMPVTGSVPEGSLLGPVLFVIYINGIDLGLINFISRFTEDAKIGNVAFLEQSRWSLQDFLKLSDRLEEWEMPFNVNKCQILQIGSENRKMD